MDAVEIDCGQLVRTMTLKVRVRGMKRAALRMSVAIGVLRLAAWIAGTGLDLRFDDDKPRAQPPASMLDSAIDARV